MSTARPLVPCFVCGSTSQPLEPAHTAGGLRQVCADGEACARRANAPIANTTGKPVFVVARTPKDETP